ncbi:MAG TPA: caspase family protein [Polyangia bacterium]
MKWLRVLLALAPYLVSSDAHGMVQRFAVIVGNNQGQGDDVRLRYAESDAAKVQSVLHDLGGFEPADIVLLRGEDAETVRSTLITVNDRIRAAGALPNTDTMLLVYYSGHADARALRLGDSSLEFRELRQLVRGSAAKFRLLVVDSCRSGALTQTKGGKIVPPFALTSPGLQEEGLALLTASAESEDAQESDALRGAFFTHALVSGLLGAADKNGDGVVDLDEAYTYSYEATIRATSRTFVGTQHPTFQYELRGQGAVVLTRPATARAGRGELTFPAGIGFFVFAESPDGAVLAELGPHDISRKLSLPPGGLFLRGRGPNFLLEGTVTAKAGQVLAVDPGGLTRVEYARLVRKGSPERAYAHGPMLGLSMHTRLPNADGPCLGGFVGYRLELARMGVAARLSACTGGFRNSAIEATTNEYVIDLGAERTWDFRRLSFTAGIGAGMTLSHQHFQTLGVAPDRLSAAPMGFVSAAVTRSISRRFYLGLELRGEGHLLRLQQAAADSPQLHWASAWRISPEFGMEF